MTRQTSGPVHRRCAPGVNSTASAALLEETFRSAAAGDRVDRTLYTDIHHYLPGALLPKVDRTTMAHSLSPLSFPGSQGDGDCGTTPTSWKVRGRQTKWILRRLYADLMPEPVRSGARWALACRLACGSADRCYESVADLLLAADARIHEYFRVEPIRRLLEENRDGRADHGKRLWALLVLESWLRQYEVGT